MNIYVRSGAGSAAAVRPSVARTSVERERRPRSPSSSDRADRPKRKPAQPDRFDGTSSVEAFLDQFDTCATYNRWTEEDRYVQLKLSLRGSAAGLLKDCREDVKSYKELQAKLRQRFDAKGREVSFRAQLRSRRRQKGETLQELYIGIGDLMHQAFPGKGSIHRDIAACDAFIDALDDPALEQRVRDKLPDNLDEAYRLAVVLEANSRGAEFKATGDRHRERGGRYDARAAYNTMEGRNGYEAAETGVAPVPRNDDANKEEINELKSAIDKLCKVVEGFQARNSAVGSRQGQTSQGPGVTSRRQSACFICHDPSHYASTCPLKGKPVNMNKDSENTAPKEVMRSSSAAATEGNRDAPPPRSRPARTCFVCGDESHLARVCPDRGTRGATGGSGNKTGVQANRVGQGGSQRVPAYLQLWYKGEPWNCLLDSGCEKSVVPRRMVKNIRLEESREELYAANGTRIATLGAITIPFMLDGMKLEAEALVTEHVMEPMLGIDWLKAHGCQMNFSNDTVSMRDKVYHLTSRGPMGACRRIVAVRTETIPAWSQGTVEGRVELSSLQEVEVKGWCTEIGEVRPGLCVARVVVPDRLDCVPVILMNVTSQDISVDARSELSELSPIDPVPATRDSAEKDGVWVRAMAEGELQREAALREGDGESAEESLTGSGAALLKSLGDIGKLDGAVAEGYDLGPLVEGVSAEVTPEEKEQIRGLLHEFRDIFSRNEFDIGETNLGEHAIDTGDAKPIRQPLRRHPQQLLQDIDTQVQKMVEAGIVEKSASPWASNLVMVRKKDGSYRMCVDMRGVNTVTRKDAYPLPRIDACLDALTGSKFYSTFDLTSGYFQVRMSSADADKTSFITRAGSFRFRRMTMGLCNAGSTFSRIMQIAMQGLNFSICLMLPR